MTPELQALGKRAVARKGQTWLPGMRLWCPERGYGRIIALTPGLLIEWERGHHRKTWTLKAAKSQLIPDLTDPATLGCLLSLLREAWRDPKGSVYYLAPVESEPGWFAEFGARAELYATEAEALVAALEAAP